MNGTRGGRSIGVESGSTVVEFILGKMFVFFFSGLVGELKRISSQVLTLT